MAAGLGRLLQEPLEGQGLFLPGLLDPRDPVLLDEVMALAVAQGQEAARAGSGSRAPGSVLLGHVDDEGALEPPAAASTVTRRARAPSAPSVTSPASASAGTVRTRTSCRFRSTGAARRRRAGRGRSRGLVHPLLGPHGARVAGRRRGHEDPAPERSARPAQSDLGARRAPPSEREARRHGLRLILRAPSPWSAALSAPVAARAQSTAGPAAIWRARPRRSVTSRGWARRGPAGAAHSARMRVGALGVQVADAQSSASRSSSRAVLQLARGGRASRRRAPPAGAARPPRPAGARRPGPARPGPGSATAGPRGWGCAR